MNEKQGMGTELTTLQSPTPCGPETTRQLGMGKMGEFRQISTRIEEKRFSPNDHRWGKPKRIRKGLNIPLLKLRRRRRKTLNSLKFTEKNFQKIWRLFSCGRKRL